VAHNDTNTTIVDVSSSTLNLIRYIIKFVISEFLLAKVVTILTKKPKRNVTVHLQPNIADFYQLQAIRYNGLPASLLK